MICSENRLPLFGIMLKRPDPSRSLTRPAGAFKPPAAAKGPSLKKRFDPADFSGSGCGKAASLPPI